jgi:16S rRNA (uracil1498-N3)-methyltransferase
MSGLKRFFCNKIEELTEISGEEFLHAVNVLRIKVGENIILLNNTDNEYTAEVISVDKKSFKAKILKKELCELESKSKILLICGFLKGDKTELVVQKAVELGVLEIVVFQSKFSSAYLSDNKIERLNKVSKEAAKQCGRSKYPLVISKNNLPDALETAENYKNKLFACEFADSSDIELTKIKGDTAIVIGSEGGFSKEEFELAKSMGFYGLSLGKRILRADTASIAMCSILAFLNGDLEQ